jgi:hypothetical protein
MPGFLGGSGSGGGGTSGEIRFPKEFIDPVTKLRVSEPQTLIDTDFEYGLQPTKWETVELINNTPSFFSASGDTTIPNITEMTTTAGSREIKITTALAHGVAVGIPINVTGTKSLTADGSYIINSIPDATTFTYLCKQNQLVTASILDLYTSIITGQFFQGSQIRISDSLGIVTNATSPQSTLTLTTDAPHGFGVNTPFYFLNLNSTISQTFDSSNTGSKTFDASNTATAQTFDGSNTLNRFSINLNNAPVTGGAPSTVVTVNTSEDTITVTHSTESFINQPLGTPLYYSVSASQGHFATNPRGVVYLKSTNNLATNSSTFQVSLTPNGPVFDLTVAITGTFQLAPLALRFPGNNVDEVAPTLVDVVENQPLVFDGANNLGSISTVNSFSNGSSIIQMQNNAGSGTSTGLFVGSMVRYSATTTAAGGLTNNTTYWITYINVIVNVAPGLVQVKLASTPGGADIVISSQGSGTHTIQQVGVSVDTDTFYVPGHGLLVGDMVKYSYPSGGRLTTSDATKDYYYVEKVLDSSNIQLTLVKGSAKDGSSAGRAANSALDILRVRPNSPDGAYWIKPDAYTGDPFRVWCNMTLEGGGWMLVFRNATEEFGAANRTPFGDQDFLVGSWTGWTYTTKTQIDAALGGSTNLNNYAANNGTNAFSPAYISAPFNDVMVIANRDSGRRLGWRHNTLIPTMRSVINTTSQTRGDSQLFASNGARAGYWQPMLDKRGDTQGTTDRGFNIYGFKIGSDRHGNDFGSPKMAGGWPNDATQGNAYNGTRGGWYNAQVGWAATDATTGEAVPQVGGGFGGIDAAGSYHRLNHHVWGWGSSRNQATWDPDRSSAYYGHAVYVRQRPS